MTAISASEPAAPLTTSLRVPSPPTTTSSPPSAAAAAASSISWPGRSERIGSPPRPSARARASSSGQRRPVVPLPLAGLTRKTALRLIATAGGSPLGERGSLGDGDVERERRHPVDGGPQLLVGDAREDALDDDVAHRQQAR